MCGKLARGNSNPCPQNAHDGTAYGEFVVSQTSHMRAMWCGAWGLAQGKRPHHATAPTRAVAHGLFRIWAIFFCGCKANFGQVIILSVNENVIAIFEHFIGKNFCVKVQFFNQFWQVNFDCCKCCLFAKFVKVNLLVNRESR